MTKTGISFSIICIIVAVLTMAFAPLRHQSQVQQGTVVAFRHVVGDKPLQLFDSVYTNRFGEPFMVTKFRYYVSHFSIVDSTDRRIVLPVSYFLINEADSLSKQVTLPYSGSIKAISFLIGIDSIKNVSAVQTGSLDPANGMFWTWNSGYVFAKLEGQSDSSHAAAHSFTWDVGGFRKNENALRTVQLQLKNKKTAGNGTITINADILSWFDAEHPLPIAQSPVCHQPGKLAMQIADNYSAMFSIAP